MQLLQHLGECGKCHRPVAEGQKFHVIEDKRMVVQGGVIELLHVEHLSVFCESCNGGDEKW